MCDVWAHFITRVHIDYPLTLPLKSQKYRVSQKKWGDVLHLISQLPE